MSSSRALYRLLFSMLCAVLFGLLMLEQYAQHAWLIDPNWYSLEETKDSVTFRCQSFRPVSFAKKKAKDTTRILFMGGSPIFGFPYRPVGTDPITTDEEQGIVGSLRQILQQNSTQKYEIINLGINGGRSSDTYKVLQKAYVWDIDILLIYDGNNEFFHVPQDFSPTLWRSALYRLFVTSAQPPPSVLVSKSPSPYGGFAQEKAVEEEFSRTLGKIIDFALEKNIQPIVITQAILRTGYDPTWSVEGPPKEEETLRLKTLRQKYPKSAPVAWKWWRQQYEKGVWDEQALVDSVDYDSLRLRARSSIQNIIRSIAQEKNIEMIDVYDSMIQNEEYDLDLFYDWVHPTSKGAHQIAHTITEHILDTTTISSVPIKTKDLEAMRQIATIWLRAACIREYDPTFRLNQARSYARKILQQQPQDEFAHGVIKIVENWIDSDILLNPNIRSIFKQQGSCLAVKIR
ncbi:MAG: hypothetical protein CL916_14895 [Deltaproteobacteria bacterium]|nr:hypothetical protein [Deltaproteobacteria bacterium]